MAEQAKYEQARQQLVADVVIRWFDVIQAQQLLELYQQRVANSRQNLEIIEAGYRQGLNNALDVYLTRNELNSELSRVAQQVDSHLRVVRQLERLIGQYPKAMLTVNTSLPLLENDIPLGLPADLVTRKPALLASWYQLLAKDAGLAYAHKQRFPSINLRAGISKAGSSITDALSNSIGWSLLGSLTSPIFNAGRLKANEAQAHLLLKQGEQNYLDTLYSAFNTVENAISAEVALKQRYQAMVKAQENALAAKTLSFEQYQKGLVSYTTVLDAQKRAFDAQSTVIQIKYQLINNRINLHVALGGDFAEPTSAQKVQ
jgi:outer membrane protein TolC